MINYEKKYKETLGKAKTFIQRWQGIEAIDSELALQELKEIFSEPCESEDDDIRESIIGFLKTMASLKDGKTVSNEDFDSVALLEWAAWLEKQRKEWNADDLLKHNQIIDILQEYNRTELIDWLENQGEQTFTEQKPVKWSKEDETIIDKIIGLFQFSESFIASGITDKDTKDVQTWLKSIRPQKQWKPSEEQMKALKEACDEHWEPDGLDPLYTLYQTLKELYEQKHVDEVNPKFWDGEKKELKKINLIKAEHGKYYYCIKDYFCGGRKFASKGDVVQALRGLPIMGLEDISEYFLPVTNIQNPTWGEEDIMHFNRCLGYIEAYVEPRRDDVKWFKSLKNRVR